MRCSYFEAGRCRSCTLLPEPYRDQVRAKQEHCRAVLGDAVERWLPAFTGPDQGFRNRAKMVVSGTTASPTLGILDPAGTGVDLRDCPLYPAQVTAALPVLAQFVGRAAIPPYDVPARRGELKHLLVTISPDAELMVRFVLRSQESMARIRKHLPWLRGELPNLAVVSVNLLPEHRAVLEGEREIVLTERDALPMRVNDVLLHLRPQSFFQTNTDVAAALYRQVREWVAAAAPRTVWDLYCGVGGFALHCAARGRTVVGVETSAEAVASARRSAAEAGAGDATFRVGDATAFALSANEVPDLVIVNPPRRGIGPDLADWLEGSGVSHLVYSSCNSESLALDLARMPSLRPRYARLLDMFPNTRHYEVALLLQRG